MSWKLTAVSSVALAVSATCQAQEADPLAARFGSLESIINISISPDGKRVAILAPRPQGGEGILVVPLEGGRPVSITGSEGGADRIRYCNFATDTRLVCLATRIELEGKSINGYSRMLAVNADGSGMRMLTPKTQSNANYEVRYGGSVIDLVSPDGGDSVLMTRANASEFTTGTFTKRDRPGLGVISIDTVTGKFRNVEQPKLTASQYLSDGKGQVRVMGATSYDSTGYMAGRDTFSYRSAGARDWKPLSVVTYDSQTSSGFVPTAVDSDLDIAYGFTDHAGFKALFKRKLVDGAQPELVLGRNDVDVDSLITIGRKQRVVGASYATERRSVEFFDPELRKLAGSLGKVLPAGSQVSFVDASSDESRLVLFVSSDTNPGMFYLFDKAKGSLAEISGVRPELASLTLSNVKPVSFPARDGTMIPGYLTLPPGSDGKNLPAIVMPHGGPSARDEWGFDWLSQYFASKGYAVLQPNYRGSAGYGSAWFKKNGFQSWQTAIGDVNDGGHWLVSQGIAAPTKLAIVGWSYGGYAALQSPVIEPDLFKAIVAIAPVTDLAEYRREFENYSAGKIVSRFVGEGPHIAAGSPARHAEAFRAPVLLFHGDLDQNVGVDESRLMAKRLKEAGKPVEYVEFGGLDHYLESSAARTKLLSKTAIFLDSTLKR